MLELSNFNLEYKIAPPESVSIIGSNSIDTAGDLYVVNENTIIREKNQRNKRLFDVFTATALLLLLLSLSLCGPCIKKGFPAQYIQGAV
jgi:O-antigen biosynthesis protein